MDRISDTDDDGRGLNGQPENAEARPDLIKRSLAVVALAAGAIATAVWIIFLGWAITEAAATNVSRIWVHLVPQRAAVAARPQPSMEYRQPSSLKGKPPKHS
jgi:hypothetical protein